MSKKYDGWVIKIKVLGKYPDIYLMWTFNTHRKRAIHTLEENWHTNYSTRRRRGELKAVKVKLVEVE